MMKVLIQNNPKYILYLWGIDGTSKEVVLKKIKNNGLEKNIKYMGTTDKINEYINAMDLMLLPSMFEGFPVTVVEWQANGLPCILSDTITPDCNLDGNVKFLPINNGVECWAEQIESCSFDVKDRASNIHIMMLQKKALT